MPGVTPAKWVNRWEQRPDSTSLTLVRLEPHDKGRAAAHGEVDMAVVRLPVPEGIFHTVALYEETTVAIFPKDHHLAAADQLLLSDLSDETLLQAADDMIPWPATAPGHPAAEEPPTTEDAIPLVAAGVGIIVVPQSLARLYARKDLDYCPIDDAPRSTVALVWRVERDDDLTQEFVGVVRGRTPQSSRGVRATTEAGSPTRTEQPSRAGRTRPRASAGKKTTPQRQRGATSKPQGITSKGKASGKKKR
ncbi:DNA-binding transcriptional regulator HcaR [Jonesia denitrificans]|nr:DNA-binding transcriptional regulator HcaR [Jonesia denitrificans]